MAPVTLVLVLDGVSYKQDGRRENSRILREIAGVYERVSSDVHAPSYNGNDPRGVQEVARRTLLPIHITSICDDCPFLAFPPARNLADGLAFHAHSTTATTFARVREPDCVLPRSVAARASRCAWLPGRNRGAALCFGRTAVLRHARLRVQYDRGRRCDEMVGPPPRPVDLRLQTRRPDRRVRRNAPHEGARSHPGLGMDQPALAD